MEHKNYLLPVFMVLLAVMFILPFFSAEGYSLISNTTSQLGAQNTPNAWVMNITFCLVGVGSIIEGLISLRNYWFQKVLMIIFGLALLSTAIFQHAPITEGVPFNILEDNVHSFSASVVGFSFTFFAFSVSFIEESTKRRLLALSVGILATGLSLMMFFFSNCSGIWQRLMFIISFGWMIIFFKDRKIKKAEH